MPEFEFWYDETATYKAWFEADSKEQAIEMLEKLEGGMISIDDLPNYQGKLKGYEVQIGHDTLEEVS
jgi:hypothetical protein